jgi:hypothetical protein
MIVGLGSLAASELGRLRPLKRKQRPKAPLFHRAESGSPTAPYRGESDQSDPEQRKGHWLRYGGRVNTQEAEDEVVVVEVTILIGQ